MLAIGVLNAKGGVGKTITTGNLAAYFDKKLGKRVLLLDLDYQGSLSTMLRAATGLTARSGNIQSLFASGARSAALWGASDSLSPTLPKSHLVQSFMSLPDLKIS